MATCEVNSETLEDIYENTAENMDITEALMALNEDTESEIPNLKPRQLEALRKAELGDCFVSLKTGYGKTLIFQLMPYVFKSTIIVICPLDVIVEQFMERFRGAVHVSSEFLGNISMDTTEYSKVKYFIGHPEQITSAEFGELLLKISDQVSVCVSYIM